MLEPINKEIYEKLAIQVRELEVRLLSASDLRNAMLEMGEDVVDINKTIKENERRLGQWRAMLEKRGYMV